ncbi:ABC transporter ATP-binding protein [Prosthecochloris sp. SCSIO W1103]|uniref:ABC transporter ATP-binding protein n=1 Tax=Prosthecochloris sp. SCSIO W1103 TaxID=2992244 RepID=UPI00223E2CE1|nr:ABC transporter ATP-binding protein [Prosthecochloris sp. SCSIO W1103]UZJ37228.1 ABC transporter ATP-binding protein [Prosthecochloris sp. SCSIO W1103]
MNAGAGVTIQMNDLKKEYKMGDMIIHALKGIDLTVRKGDFLAIMGSSGSGKSTLMNLIGCLDKATSGEYLLDGKSVISLNKNEYALIRNEKIGFVFQGFNLLNRTSAIENVQLPLIYNRKASESDHKEMAFEVLKLVGLQDRVYHEPHQLSGGQQQRVAIARALINNPSILLADEPTGNLDTATSNDIMKLFGNLNERNITLIIVTHEPDIAEYAKRTIYMNDGLIASEKTDTY